MFTTPRLALAAVLTVGAAVTGASDAALAKDPVATVGKSATYETDKTFQWTEHDRLVRRYYDEMRASNAARDRAINTALEADYLARKIAAWEKEMQDPEKAGLRRALTIVINGARKDIEHLWRINREARQERLEATIRMKHALIDLERLGYYFNPGPTRPAINLDPRRFSYENRAEAPVDEVAETEPAVAESADLPAIVPVPKPVLVSLPRAVGPIVIERSVIERRVVEHRLPRLHRERRHHHTRLHDPRGERKIDRMLKRHRTMKRAKRMERRLRAERRQMREMRKIRNVRMMRDRRHLRTMRMAGRHAFRPHRMNRMHRGGFGRFRGF